MLKITPATAADIPELCALLALLFTQEADFKLDRVALLENMLISPNARVGSQLIEQAIQSAQLNGCKRITLLTDASNESAQRFYQKHGFTASAMVPFRILL